MTLNLILATNTPGKTRDWLVDRGLMLLENGEYRFRNRDIRFTPKQIPNPINSWNMYAVRFVRQEAIDDEDAEPDATIPGSDRFMRSRFVKWLKNNGTRVDFNWDINGDGSEIIPLVLFRVDFDGGQFYIMEEHPRIHRWQ